jgi:hypothetical protein
MCQICSYLDKNIRWEKDSLAHIRSVLGELTSTGKLVELGEVTPNGPFLSVRYKCMECGAVWRLTYPDHGMRGGFVRE